MGCDNSPAIENQTEKPAETSETTTPISQETQAPIIEKKAIDSKYALNNVTIRGLHLSNYMVIADSMANNAALVLQNALKANTGYTINLGLDEDLYKYKSRYVFLLTVPVNGKSYDLKSDEALFYEDNGDFYIILGSRDITETKAVDYFLTKILPLNEDYTSSVKKDAMDLTGYRQTVTLPAVQELVQVSKQADEAKTKILSADNHYSAANVTGNGKCYYVSASGNDSNDGLSPSTAWLTLGKVSGSTFPAGSVVLFERGGLWRGQLTLKSDVIYSSYGQGEKPKIYGSLRDAVQVGSWKTTDVPNVWSYSVTYSSDVGNLIFNNGEAWGYKEIATVDNFKGSIEELKTNYHFWQNKDTGRVYLYYDGGNPGDVFKSIEFAVTANIVYASSVKNIVFDNFCLKYGGAHGVSAVNVTNIKVQYCEIGWIGGGILSGTARYGNGIQLAHNGDGFYMDHNYVYQVYDAGLTHQFDTRANPSSTSTCLEKDVQYTNNLVENCFFNIEYFIMLNGIQDRKMEDILISDNILRYAGYGWGFQRPDSGKPGPSNIKGWSNSENYLDGYFIIENNTMALSKYVLSLTCCSLEDDIPVYRNNRFVQYANQQSITIGIKDVRDTWDVNALAQNQYLKNKGNSFYTVK